MLKIQIGDGLKYKDEILDELKQRTGINAKKDLHSVEMAIMQATIQLMMRTMIKKPLKARSPLSMHQARSMVGWR